MKDLRFGDTKIQEVKNRGRWVWDPGLGALEVASVMLRQEGPQSFMSQAKRALF